MDCSGFTKTVYYLNGLMLPRDASQQVHVGIEVETDPSLKNLQPGDFLFFGRKATSSAKEKITHVAIYLGDGKMIHSSERVRIQSLKRGDEDFAENRLNTLVRAKRLLENIGMHAWSGWQIITYTPGSKFAPCRLASIISNRVRSNRHLVDNQEFFI